MTIERIEIVKSDLEKLFDKVDPDWKKQPLYRWQYGGDHPEEFATSKLYDLEGYKKGTGGGLTIYAKKGGFIVEQSNNFGFTNVLTNVAPQREFSKTKKITINELEIFSK